MPESNDRSLSAARLIDADCGRFESQWKGGHQPRIEQFVDATPELMSEVEGLLGRATLTIDYA